MHCLQQSTATYSTTMMIPPFQLLQDNYDYKTFTILGKTVRWFHGYYQFTQFHRCLWQFLLCWCPSTNLQIPWFCGYPLMILRTPFDNSGDILWRLWCIHRFHKVYCDMYCKLHQMVREHIMSFLQDNVVTVGMVIQEGSTSPTRS